MQSSRRSSPVWKRTLRFLVHRHALFYTLVFAVVLCREPAPSPASLSWGLVLAAGILLAVLIEKITLLIAAQRGGVWDRLELGLLLIVGVHLFLALTGASPTTSPSPFYPVAYFLLAALGAWGGRWVLAAAMASAFILIDCGRAVWLGASGWDFVPVGLHGLYAVVAGFGATAFVATETRARRRAEEAVNMFESRIGDFHSRLVRRDEGLEAMSSEGRRNRLISHVSALDDALYGLLSETAQIVSAHSLVLLLVDPNDEHVFRLREAVSESDAIAFNAAVRVGEGLLGFVAAQGESVQVGDIRLMSGDVPYYIRNPGVRSLAAVPVESMRGDRNHVEGVLVADSLADDAFDEGALRALTLGARQIRDSISRALMQQVHSEEAREFAALYDFSQELSRSLDLDQVLDKTLTAVERIVPYDGALVSLVEGSGHTDEGRARVARGSGRSVIRAVRGALVPDASFCGREFSHTEGFVGWVTTQGKYLYHPDVTKRQMKRAFIAKSLPLKGVGTFLSYPLSHGDDVLGALTVACEQEEAFTSEEVKTIRVVANLSAVSIANALLLRRTEELATTDGLTGLCNHRVFQDKLGEELERLDRHPGPLSIILGDIDHFKDVNDTYGHPVGDTVLRGIARLIADSARKIDFAARYGGEEFVLVLPETIGKGARTIAERLRKTVKRRPFPVGDAELHVTISLGIATYPDDARDKADLIACADAALYEAKRSGRNRVVHYADIVDTIARRA